VLTVVAMTPGSRSAGGHGTIGRGCTTGLGLMCVQQTGIVVCGLEVMAVLLRYRLAGI